MSFVLLLFSRLSAVAGLTQHLTVSGIGLSTVVPRVDVVAFHFVYLEMFAAHRADTVLTLIGFTLLIVRESSYVEMFFITRKKILVNAFF